jgi:hypothetical protein
MRTELVIDPIMVAFAEEVQVEIRQLGEECIGIVETVNLAPDGFAAELVRKCFNCVLEHVFEKSLLMHAQHGEILDVSVFVFPQHKRMLRLRHEGADGDAILVLVSHLVDAEYGVRIEVFGVNDPVDILYRGS